jgi:WD40 repeat protein
MLLQGSQDSMRVWAHRKVFREFTDLRHVQTLSGHKGAVWKVEFSDTGFFMASAGQDGVIRIWQSRRAPEEKSALAQSLVLGCCAGHLHPDS